MSKQMIAKWWSGLSALKWVLTFLAAMYLAFIALLLAEGAYSVAGFLAATLTALLLGGVIGTIPRAPKRRDLAWSAMYKVSDHMSGRYGVHVAAVRLHTLRWVTEGIGVPTLNLFEPVRQRNRFTKHWRQIQRVQDAASNAGRTLRNIRNSAC